MILSKAGRDNLPERTLIIEYVNPYGTCGICGAAMRIRHELPASVLCGSGYEEMPEVGIEVKAGSDECLAKSAAVA